MRKTLFVFACVILCSSFAGAQATGSVCDGEQGAAYGLCNAFCDAMDCDGSPEASATACNKVQSKFEQITGHQPPCLEPQCVGTELPEFLAVASAPATVCIDTINFISVVTEAGLLNVALNPDGQGFCDAVPTAGGYASTFMTPAEYLGCLAYVRSLCPLNP